MLMSRKADREGLSLGYRVLYGIKYLGYHLFGPAELGPLDDPHVRLKRERAAKVAEARERRRAREAAKAANSSRQ
jgi:hypothetical protein